MCVVMNVSHFKTPSNAAFQLQVSLLHYTDALHFNILKLSSAGVKKLNMGNHNISGIELQLQVVNPPLPSELEQAITFPSMHSIASRAMQPPQQVQQQQDTRSRGPVPVPYPRTKKVAKGLSTDDIRVSSTPTRLLSLATAADGQAFTQTEEHIKPEGVPDNFGLPANATLTHSGSGSIASESMTHASRVVRVVGILPHWDEKLLNMAFDDDDKGGGEIVENGIQINGTEALITFQDPEGM